MISQVVEGVIHTPVLSPQYSNARPTVGLVMVATIGEPLVPVSSERIIVPVNAALMVI